VALALVIAWYCASANAKEVLGPMLLAGTLAFGFGLAEDLTKTVGVRARLLATMGSGLAAWGLTGVAMQNTGFAALDTLLQWTPLAALFTAFAVGGLANAINIIDGLNGLASGAVGIMTLGLAVLAWQVNDQAMVSVALMVSLAAFGFFMVNWPMGRIFLGDGGAYLLGFCLAWLALLLPMRHPELHGWSTLMVCAYPVVEVATSVIRRHHRLGHHPGQPDKVHMHHLVHRRFVCLRWPQLSRRLKNGLAGLLCLLWPLACAIWANIYPTNSGWMLAGLVVLVLAYGVVYKRLSLQRG
jgi:UDP-N-acetylmuramyl pentapeptide phosphotransferase/UDP-N-acetylglucosamine-1-phosphate transferase